MDGPSDLSAHHTACSRIKASSSKKGTYKTHISDMESGRIEWQILVTMLAVITILRLWNHMAYCLIRFFFKVRRKIGKKGARQREKTEAERRMEKA